MEMGIVGRRILYCIYKLSMTMRRIVRYYERKGIDKQGTQVTLNDDARLRHIAELSWPPSE